jgi:hypothetical protein
MPLVGCESTREREKDFSGEMRSCALVRSHIWWLKICLVLLRVEKERILPFSFFFHAPFYMCLFFQEIKDSKQPHSIMHALCATKRQQM